LLPHGMSVVPEGEEEWHAEAFVNKPALGVIGPSLSDAAMPLLLEQGELQLNQVLVSGTASVEAQQLHRRERRRELLEERLVELGKHVLKVSGNFSFKVDLHAGSLWQLGQK
jgi:hypothetical protein